MTKRVEKRALSLFVALLSMAVLSLTLSCGERREENDRIGVVVSILPLADFVKQVGGDEVEVTVMIPPGASPHSYEPKPSQLRAVSHAEMFVKVGTGVEFELAWMDRLVQINKDMLVLNSSEGIRPLGRDPHVWLSPLNAEKMIRNICDGLVKIDPGNAQRYASNKERYLRQLAELDGYMRERLGDVKDRRFIVYHPAWGYLARDYDLKQIPVQREGKEPTAEEIGGVVAEARTLGRKVVFVSPQFASRSAETVADEIGGITEFLDPLPQDYIADMRIVVQQLVQAMR